MDSSVHKITPKKRSARFISSFCACNCQTLTVCNGLMKVLSLLKINTERVVLWWHHIPEKQLCFLRVTSAAKSWTPQSNLPRNGHVEWVSILTFALLLLFLNRGCCCDLMGLEPKTLDRQLQQLKFKLCCFYCFYLLNLNIMIKDIKL